MSRVTLHINGADVTAEVEPRTHLADFLRESRLLTGTHLGCEHGVCGACTLLIDDAPARSCIALAVACDGADIRTIEELQNDPVVVRLRAAFTAEHALQCGYCTPAMLVTARDIVHRLPDADETRIRLELAGNLCRCTGYAGIVRAIQRVLAEGDVRRSVAAPAATTDLRPLPIPRSADAADAPGGLELNQTLLIAAPLAAVWAAARDPQLLAGCMPGARLEAVDGDQLRGELRASLGPIEARFAGEGRVRYDDAQRCIELDGDGRDARSGTRVRARVTVTLRERDGGSTEATARVTYALRGPLAQFARGAIAQEFAAALASDFTANLARRLAGASPVEQRPLPAGRLLWRALRQWLAAMFRRVNG